MMQGGDHRRPLFQIQKKETMSDKTILMDAQPMFASQLVEIPIANAATNVPIPDQPQLRNQGDEVVIIKAIRLITAKTASNGATSGTATTPVADLRKIFLVLYANGWEKGYFIPVMTLNDINDNDSTAATTIQNNPQPTLFSDWENVDWNKSRLQFAQGTSASQASAFMFQVQYQKFRIVNGQRQLVNGTN